MILKKGKLPAVAQATPKKKKSLTKAALSSQKLKFSKVSAEDQINAIIPKIREILLNVGEDPTREGLLNTPKRFAKSMHFLTSGTRTTVGDVVGEGIFSAESSEMVIVRDIELYSLCEHHVLPFFGKAHVAYIPNKKIIGLSKIPRIVDVYARRLQVQERLTTQVAEALMEVIEPLGVAVVIEAAHLCMMMRGVEKQNSTTITSAMRGTFIEDATTRKEFLDSSPHARQMSEFSFIDSHCHLTSEKIRDQADLFIQEAVASGVSFFGLAGVESREWAAQNAFLEKYPGKFVSHYGLHPWWVEKFSDEEISKELSLLEKKLPEANGLGETGLDHAPKRNPDRFLAQEKAFQIQIDLALQFQKPLVLHIVHAHEAAVKILKDRKAERVPLICHSYSGNVTQLEEYLKLGAVISYNGNIARASGYENSKKALTRTPLDRVLFETDAPDQAEHHGELNRPINVIKTYEKAAILLGVELKKLQQKVSENFSKIYYS